jgi:Spy/CpxP family protein refolding chaperone
MITRKVLLAAATSLGLLSAQGALAQTSPAPAMGMGDMHHSSGMDGMHMSGALFQMLLRSANLTRAQQQQVQLILNSNMAQMQGLHQQLQTLHEQIAGKLLSPGAVSAADLKPMVQEASRLEGQLNQNMADTALAIRNVLTPEQIGRLAEVHHKLQTLHTQIQSLMGSSHGAAQPDN